MTNRTGLSLAVLAAHLGLVSCAAAPLESLTPSNQPGYVTLEISSQPVHIDPNLRDVAGFIHRVLPNYPQQAIDARVEGDVVVHVLIDPDGWPREVQLVKSISMLDEGVITAVRASAYRPSRNFEGEPIQAWVSITAHFEPR